MDNLLSYSDLPAPRIERVRHELRRRSLVVSGIERVTPGMLRITLSGEDLADFVSLGADDHIKVFVPGADGTEERRDYTPRRYDNDARLLALDFALHEAGPVTAWAMNARVGDRLEIGGPRGSAVVSGEIGRGSFVQTQRQEPDPPYLPERLGEVIDLSILKPVCESMHHEKLKQALGWLAESLPASSALSFRPNVVFPRHRAVATEWLRECGLAVSPQNVSLTNGATAGMGSSSSSSSSSGSSSAGSSSGVGSSSGASSSFGLGNN